MCLAIRLMCLRIEYFISVGRPLISHCSRYAFIFSPPTLAASVACFFPFSALTNVAESVASH